MADYIKYYTVKINEKARTNKQGLWYTEKRGKEFKTKLAIVENRNGSKAAAFKCVEFPFYHIYPQHCTVIKEEIVAI